MPGSAGNPIPTYTGRKFQPGDWMIVGDGPGGQILPTSELVVFDQPGQVFSGPDTAQILGQDGPGEPGFFASSIAGNGGAAASSERAIVIKNLYLPNVRDGRQFVTELDAALDAMQRVGLSN